MVIKTVENRWLKVQNEEQWGRFQELMRDPATDIREVKTYFDFKNNNFYVVDLNLTEEEFIKFDFS